MEGVAMRCTHVAVGGHVFSTEQRTMEYVDEFGALHDMVIEQPVFRIDDVRVDRGTWMEAVGWVCRQRYAKTLDALAEA
jgi:allantoicase